ncbi:MAG: efflux RND transporter periplasmic adaptor subunit [Pseudoxanthomonas sp.]
MKKRNIIIIVVAAALVVGAGGFMAMRGKGEKATEVEVMPVKRATIVQKVNGTGKIQPNTEINISADVSAKITRVGVKEGDHVEKGQFLVELDRQKYLAQVQSQEASVRSAQANARLARDNRDQAERVLKRAQELVARKLQSQSDLDAARTTFQTDSSRYQSATDQVQQAIGGLKQAQDDLSKTTIYAPISGTVSDLRKEAGEIAIGSQFQEDVIMIIAQLGAMEAVINVDENDINAIKIGQAAEITVDAALGEKITGKVSEIASSANVPAQGSTVQKTEFEVKVAIDSDTSKLRPGMTASADIVTATHTNALSVPIQSVTVRTPDQLKGKDGEAAAGKFTAGKDGFVEIVFVVKDGKAVAKPVTTGIQSDDAIEIKTGVAEGEQAVSGSYRAISRDLNIGDSVQIKKPGEKSAGNAGTAAGGG